MKGRTPTAKEKKWMQSARQVGCAACIKKGNVLPYEVPEEHVAVHHIEGKTKPGAHLLTIGLCPSHHQHGVFSVHGNRSRFEIEYGTELELLEMVRHIVSTS